MKQKLLYSFIFLLILKSFAFSQNADIIYSKMNKAVVTIYTFDKNDNPLKQGSGVVIDSRGWVVTNYHIYSGAPKIIVKQKNKLIPVIKIIAADKDKDILLLQISPNAFPTIAIGDSKTLKVGQKIFSISSPLGLENSITEGIISGFRDDAENSQRFIQISAALSHGSSGGAIVNNKGELIGISTLSNTNGQNLNFAIPINEILNFYSQQKVKTSTVKKLINNSNLYTIQVNGKYGFMNSIGKVVIDPIFEENRDFNEEEMASVKYSGKWGTINKNGEYIIEPQYNEVLIFIEGLACVKINSKYGFIDKSNKIIIPPKFKDWAFFSENLAHEKNDENNYGYIDKKGMYIISPKFKSAGPFIEGLAYVELLNGQYGYINKKEELVIKITFNEPTHFSEGLARFTDYSLPPPRVGCMNKQGKVVIKPQFDYVGDFHSGRAKFAIGEVTKWGFIDNTGAIVIEPKYDLVGEFSEGLASFKIGKKKAI